MMRIIRIMNHGFMRNTYKNKGSIIAASKKRWRIAIHRLIPLQSSAGVTYT